MRSGEVIISSRDKEAKPKGVPKSQRVFSGTKPSTTEWIRRYKFQKQKYFLSGSF